MRVLIDEVGKLLKKEGLDPSLIERPPRHEIGDLAFPCFGLAKKRKMSPPEIAEEIAGRLRETGNIRSIEAIGPYVNFHADWAKLGGIVIKSVMREKDRYGSGPLAGKKEKIRQDTIEAGSL